MKDSEIRWQYWFEKIVGFTIMGLVSVAVWHISDIREDIKNLTTTLNAANEKLHARVDDVQRYQYEGALKLGEILKEHESNIRSNNERLLRNSKRLDKLEEVK